MWERRDGKREGSLKELSLSDENRVLIGSLMWIETVHWAIEAAQNPNSFNDRGRMVCAFE